MASVNRPNLLFYSRTNNCIELLRMMKQYQIDKEFKIINVDNNKNEVIKKIKVIPTMIIPSINKVIVGEDVNEFVISIIKSRIKESRSFRSFNVIFFSCFLRFNICLILIKSKVG